MGLRPGRCYRNAKKPTKGNSRGGRGHKNDHKAKRPYTRTAVKVPRKNFIGATPALRIRQFNMGNPKLKYNVIADLKVRDGFDLRDNAIESARMAINRHLVKTLGKDGFFMKVRVYPSNILRENKAAQGAGADRVSQGMSMSFGKPIGRASRLRANQVVYSVLCMKGQETNVREGLMRAKSRFSSDVYVLFHEDVESIGTKPTKKIRDVKAEPTAEQKKAEEDKAAEGKAGEKKDAKAEAGKEETGDDKKEDSKDEKKK
jgi:large subunit ribosomal protein L10e